MKIIRHGDIGETVKKFRCEVCGCEFEATADEYDVVKTEIDKIDCKNLSTAFCTCPECGDFVKSGHTGKNIEFMPIVHAHIHIDEYGTYICSHCNSRIFHDWRYKQNYCNFCGAKLDLVTELI